jgi:predicted DNA-binding transcriptional regulator AlpA
MTIRSTATWQHRNSCEVLPMQTSSFTTTTDPDELLTEAQAAQLLKLSIRTLQAWRFRATGPRFVRAGRAVRYRRRELNQWVELNSCQGHAPA